jgi:hypothetical protein
VLHPAYKRNLLPSFGSRRPEAAFNIAAITRKISSAVVGAECVLGERAEDREAAAAVLYSYDLTSWSPWILAAACLPHMALYTLGADLAALKPFHKGTQPTSFRFTTLTRLPDSLWLDRRAQP